MVFTPDYSLNVGGENVDFLFNTKALRLYCESKGIEKDMLYHQISKYATPVEKHTEEMKGAKNFVDDDFADLLFYGHKSWCIYNKQPFIANDDDKDLWMDFIGGRMAQAVAFVNVLGIIAKKAMNNGNGEEKKSEIATNQGNP